jgi:hypothetical protein
MLPSEDIPDLRTARTCATTALEYLHGLARVNASAALRASYAYAYVRESAAQAPEQPQRVLRSGRVTSEVECLACGTVHRVDTDEDGDAAIDQVPCQGSDDCTARLCDECRRQCAYCDLYTCASHLDDRGMCECCRAQQDCAEDCCHE